MQGVNQISLLSRFSELVESESDWPSQVSQRLGNFLKGSDRSRSIRVTDRTVLYDDTLFLTNGYKTSMKPPKSNVQPAYLICLT